MLCKNRYVSSLDLKLLGARFITIPSCRLDTNTSCSSTRNNKNYKLPTNFRTMPDEEFTIVQEDIIKMSQKDQKEGSKKLCKLVKSSSQKNKPVKTYSEKQKLKIRKYKNLISELKQKNGDIQKEIQRDFLEEKLTINQPRTKAIKIIAQSGNQELVRDTRFSLSPQARKYQRIYEELALQRKTYKNQSLQLQKKFSSNNLHKNFETFLLSHNKRIPQFLKNIK